MTKDKLFDYGVFEAGQQNAENFQKYLQENQQAFSEYCQKNQDTLNEILELGFNYGALWQEYMNEQLRRLSNAKDINDVMATEAGLTSEYSAKFNEANSRLYELISSSMNEQLKNVDLPGSMDKILTTEKSSKKPVKKKRSK